MASPQVEDGYTKIANELLEAMARIRIPGEPRQVFDVVLRRTYGFNKKADAISLSQFCLATGLKRNTICRAVQKLLSLNLITKKETTLSTLYAINKDFETWKPLPKKRLVVPKKRIIITKKENNCTQKRDIQKKYKKKKKNISSEILELSNLLADKILINNPKHRSLSNGKREKTVLRWTEDIDKLVRIDKQSVEDIRLTIEWSQEDPFWKQNILSAEKLRQKWDQLYLKAKEARKNLKPSYEDPIDKLKEKMKLTDDYRTL
ncbi:MAG: replication protein [Nitrospirota bacterium]